jgi:hypothetical protein
MCPDRRTATFFPRFFCKTIGGGSLTLPDDLAGSFGVIPFYRGLDARFVGAQLGGFAAHKAEPKAHRPS